MKKILIAMLSVAALCAGAKTPSDLVAEFNAKASAPTDWAAAAKIASDNSADVAAAISVWAADANITKPESELTAEQHKNAQAARMIAGQYLTANPSQIKTLPLRFACFVISSKVFDEFSADNPNFYADLKAADFKVDGKPLPANSVIQIALAAGDTDYVAQMPVRVAASSPRYVGAMADWLLAQSDVAAALKKAQSIESYYITSGREVPTKLKAVLTALTRRLVTSKI